MFLQLSGHKKYCAVAKMEGQSDYADNWNLSEKLDSFYGFIAATYLLRSQFT